MFCLWIAGCALNTKLKWGTYTNALFTVAFLHQIVTLVSGILLCLMTWWHLFDGVFRELTVQILWLTFWDEVKINDHLFFHFQLIGC